MPPSGSALGFHVNPRVIALVETAPNNDNEYIIRIPGGINKRINREQLTVVLTRRSPVGSDDAMGGEASHS